LHHKNPTKVALCFPARSRLFSCQPYNKASDVAQTNHCVDFRYRDERRLINAGLSCRAQKLYRSPGIANYAMVRTLSSAHCAVSKAGTHYICIAHAAIHEAVGAALGHWVTVPPRQCPPIVTPCSICVFRIGRNRACKECVMRRSRVSEPDPTKCRRYFGHSLI
jgi:hypothetical protein